MTTSPAGTLTYKSRRGGLIGQDRNADQYLCLNLDLKLSIYEYGIARGGGRPGVICIHWYTCELQLNSVHVCISGDDFPRNVPSQ